MLLVVMYKAYYCRNTVIVRGRDDITLFCYAYIYNVSWCFLYIFCAEFKSDECQLEKVGISLKIQGQRSISRSNIIFQQMKLGTSAIPHFHVILTGQSIYKIILIIPDHLHSQKLNFKVK